MHIGDDARRHARERPAEEREGRLLAALREHRVGPQAPELPGDAHGEERVEGDAVEHPRADGPNEPEARVAVPVASRRRPQDVDVELPRERVELLRERRRERERVPVPPDQEQPPLHGSDACLRTSSIRAKTASSE